MEKIWAGEKQFYLKTLARGQKDPIFRLSQNL